MLINIPAIKNNFRYQNQIKSMNLEKKSKILILGLKKSYLLHFGFNNDSSEKFKRSNLTKSLTGVIKNNFGKS